MDGIKNVIQKNRLRWFGHVMPMAEERICKKMLHAKMEGRQPTGRPITRWIDQIRKGIYMREKNWEK